MNHGKKLRARGLSHLHDATPIFHRSNLAYPLSPETPGLLFDLVKSKDGEYPGDKTMYFSVYDMTYRYALHSDWFKNLLSIVRNCCDTNEESNKGKSTSVSNEDENDAMLKV